MTSEPNRISTPEAAAILGVTPRALQQMRMRKIGPPFERFTLHSPCRYVESAVREWLADRTFDPEQAS